MSKQTKDEEPDIVVTSRKALRALIREEVADAVRSALEPTQQRWVSVEKAGDHAGVTPQTIRRWIVAGLPATHLGRDYRMRIADLDAWLEQHRAVKQAG